MDIPEELQKRVRWHNAQICPYCWTLLKGPVEPVRLLDSEPTECVFCQASTAELPGIFIRVYGIDPELP